MIKWDDFDDSVELKKFIDNCEVKLHYLNLSNPLGQGVGKDNE